MRFCNHRPYEALKTIPVAQKNAPQVFTAKQPTKIKNSPIKLLVPGNPILAIVKIMKNTENKGIVVKRPEKYLMTRVP
jgi:hypothetical protein